VLAPSKRESPEEQHFHARGENGVASIDGKLTIA
jgi:hypothetical protein